MVRTPCRDENGMKKGTWTPDEDRKLIAYVTRYGCWNWRQLPKFAGLSRCGKSCRLRWMNYLRPNIKRGNYSKEEEETIVKLHEKLGNRWSAIAAQLPGRTDNEIKNHWHTNLKKRKNNKQCNSSFSSSATNTEETPSYSSLDAAVDQPIKKAIFPNEESTATPQVTQKTDDRVDNSSQLSPSPQPSSSEVSSMIADNNFVNWVDDINVTSMEAYAVSQFIDDNQFIDDFWTEPFLADNSYIPSGFYTPLMDSEFMYPLFGGDFL